MSARLPDPARSRAVLIGCAEYRNRTLDDLPAVTANLTGLRDRLTDPVLGGFTSASCTLLDEAIEPRKVRAVLREQAQEATDTFLVYFSGHGFRDKAGKELAAAKRALLGRK